MRLNGDVIALLGIDNGYDSRVLDTRAGGAGVTWDAPHAHLLACAR
jgi:hypothetical protein